ncbi:hypothetical protein QDR37_05930 [Amnibacterium sp. CER49]|uniref:hypothetical protein n=1 Tax=Amnibacterium sp. CER49 TaxID=3039161 RepID=UPI00244BFF58|nr:hypothetical protein [Amnibacterium sp. CER49]MDH2443479.1 hypothetical protein [Amnibacterium sp. CER49]
MTREQEHAAAEAAWGTSEPVPDAWRSGPWSLELRGDELADLRFGEHRVLRAVRAVARDRDWGTVPVAVLGTEVGDTSLALELRMAGLGADLDGRLVVETRGDALRIAFTAVSRTDFLRNRVGLVVLHPPEVAGRNLTVVAPDGSRTATRFPERIAPHQPARRIAALEWDDHAGRGGLAVEGDVFEMEDQRNWTDASFKTYSTPLDLPFPALLPRGARVEQALTLTWRPAKGAAAAVRRERIRLRDAGRPVPQVGLGASTAPDPAPLLGRPPADALLVELDLTTASWRAALRRALVEARGLPLDVRLVARGPTDVAPAVAALARVDLARLGVFDASTHVTEAPLLEALRAALGSRGVPAVGGARSHFAELNRTHERLPQELAAVTCSVTPQMHARERSQLVESLAMQRRVALDAVAIAGERPVHVGPITLRPRFNAVATSAAARPRAAELSDGYGAELEDATDPRQASAALAAWTVASAAACAVQGVASLTWFEWWGPRGVVTAAGEPLPVLEAVEALAAISDRPMLEDDDPGRDDLWALGALDGDRWTALVANLAPREQRLPLEWPDATAQDVVLAPFAWVRLTRPRGMPGGRRAAG